MKYVRKTADRQRVGAAWLIRRRKALFASGLTDLELNALQWFDVDGLTSAQAGQRFCRTGTRALQIYWTARRKLAHPRRSRLVPASLRSEFSPRTPR